jgi:hypothetical protein
MPFYITLRIHLLLLFSISYSWSTFGQSTKSNDYWISFVDTVKDEYGYKNMQGDTVIQLGKYNMCFTDTFRTYAIVLKPNFGFVAIDRQQKILYKVFPFDNGLDYTSDGLFRIVEDNKIGYANSSTGKIIIKPQYECAFPFDKGIAKVSLTCKTQSDGEHSIWLSKSWFYIDKKGRKVNKQK